MAGPLPFAIARLDGAARRFEAIACVNNALRAFGHQPDAARRTRLDGLVCHAHPAAEHDDRSLAAAYAGWASQLALVPGKPAQLAQQAEGAEKAFRKPLRWGLFALGALRPARRRNAPRVPTVFSWR